MAFTAEGFVHAIFVWLTLGYFTLGRGPRTDSAPLSRFWLLMCCMIERVPESVATNEMERITGVPMKNESDQPPVTDMAVSSGAATDYGGTETITGAIIGKDAYVAPQSPAAWTITDGPSPSSQAQTSPSMGGANYSNLTLPPTIGPSPSNRNVAMWGAPPPVCWGVESCKD